MANSFANEIAKFLNRADTVRVVGDDPNSMFVRTRLHEKDGKIAVLRTDSFGSKVWWLSADNTESTDAPIFRIDSVVYGKNEEIKAAALSGIVRIFESVDTVYVAVDEKKIVDVPADASTGESEQSHKEIAGVRMMRFDRKNGFYESSVALEDISEDLACYVQEFIFRARKGKIATDQRKTEWVYADKTKLTTNYGRFVSQRKADRR